jgi:hypothetical protein
MGVGVFSIVDLFLEIPARFGTWKYFFLSPPLSESQRIMDGDGNIHTHMSKYKSISATFFYKVDQN